MEPDPGVDYPMQLGASLLGGRRAAGADEYCTLRYDFKPASAARAPTGQMDVQLGSQKVSLQMGEAEFAGKYEPSKDGLDCIAVFDGTSFRIELLGAAVKNLRHGSGAGRRAGSAQGQAGGGAPATSALPADLAQPSSEDAYLAAAAGADMATADGPGTYCDPALSTELEDDLLRALMDDTEGVEGEGGEEEEHGAAVEAAQAEAMDQDAAGAAEAGESEEEREEEEEEGEEEEEEEEAAVAEAGAGHGQQPAAADDRQQQQQQQQQQQASQQRAVQAPLLPAAPSMAREEMTDLDLMFFGFDGGSPEPPAQQGTEGTGGGNGGGEDESGSSSGDEEGGGGGSEPEQEEI